MHSCWPVKNKGGYLFTPPPVVEARTASRGRKVSITVVAAFKSWLNIQLRFELEILVPDIV